MLSAFTNPTKYKVFCSPCHFSFFIFIFHFSFFILFSFCFHFFNFSIFFFFFQNNYNLNETKSVSAFRPVCNPSVFELGKKSMAYFFENHDEWKVWNPVTAIFFSFLFFLLINSPTKLTNDARNGILFCTSSQIKWIFRAF